MAQELTDEEVFGGAPAAAAGELGDFEVGIGRPAGYPSASAVTPKNQASINFGTLLKDPGAALSMLGDRFTATGVDSLKHGSIGGLLGGLLGDALTTSGGTDIYGKTGQQRLEESRAAEKARRPEGPKSGLEFLTDLGSGLLYGMAAPESYATLPAKLAAPIAKVAEKVATRPGVQRAVTRAAEGAISNVALDPLIQAGNIVREQQDGYSPVQTLMAGATGGALSPSLGLAGDVIASQAVKAEAARAARETQRYADAVAKPWTVEDLWGGLEKQEGARGKMDVVSPKGAKGPGQLMPDTAQYVANKLGRPELAAAALSDDPNMAWANRLLGQTYLKEQLDAFDGDPALALAAYNAGPGKVREWVARFGKPDEVGRAKWVEMIPFGETRNYVKKILGDSVGAPVKLAEPELQARAQYMADQARTQEPAQPDVQAEMQKAATEQQAQAEKAVETAGQQQAATVEQAQQDLTARSQEIEQEIRQATSASDDWRNVTTPAEGNVMGRNYRLTGEAKEVGGVQYVETDWDSGAGGEGRAWMPVSGPDAVPELRLAAERGGILSQDRQPRQIAGPEDWNEPQPVDAGDEFDRLSGTGKYAQPKPARERDLTDDALDIMRSGKAVQVGQGESLIGALVREGGVRDEGGELTNILGGAGDTQLLKRLRRVNTGMALDDATLWAWQRGYIGKPDGDRPHIQELLDAIGEEGAGRKRYAQNNEEARLVQERIESLDEMLGYLGMDPRTHSNDEIRAAMDDFMESANRFEDDDVRYEEELEPGSFGLGPQKAQKQGPAFDTSRPWPEYREGYEANIEALKAKMKEQKAAAAGDIPDTRGQGQQYHGSRGEVPKLEEGYYNPDNIYGGMDTFYTTDALDVAKGYGRRNPNAAVYTVDELAPVQMFSMEEPRTEGQWQTLLYGREFAPDGSDAPRGLDHELQGIEMATLDHGGQANLRQVFDEIRDSSAGDGYSKDDVQEMFGAIIERLRELGFGGMEHTGGLKTNRQPHTVKIYFEPHKQIRLSRVDDAMWRPSAERVAEAEKLTAQMGNIERTMAAHEKAHTEAAKGPPRSAHAKAKAAGFRIRDMDAILGASKGAGPKYRDQPRMQAIPSKDGVVLPKLKGTRDIAKVLLKKLGIVRRQGRVRMRDADGVYSKSTGVIRTKGIHELDVVAHEIGHALEYTKKYPTLLATMKAYEQSLRADDYEPGKGRRYEGFAEFFRRYMTNPEAAERVHPQFFHAFERAMATDAPDDLKVMKQAQADYREFMTAPSIEAMRTKMTNPQKMGIIDAIRKGVDEGVPEAVGDFMHEVYRGVFNSIHPWSRVVDKVQDAIEKRDGVRLDLKAADDPSKLLAAMPYVALSGHTDLFGVRDYDDPTQITSASLIDALTLALGGKGILGTDALKGWSWKNRDIEDFGMYLVGRRVLHLYDRFRDGKMDRPPDDTGIGDRSPAWEQVVAELELKNPQYREAADMVYDWTDAMLKKRVKAGFISPEAYMQLQIDHPDYVPLFRDMDGFGGSGGSSLAQAGKMKHLQGSDRNYINPIHSLVQMAYQQAAMVQQNDAVRAYHDLVKLAPNEMGFNAEPVPAKDITSVRVGVNEVLEKAEKLVGVTDADAAIIRNVLESMFHDDDTVSVFRAKDTQARRGENLIPYWKDGEMIMLELPEGAWGKHMIEALAGMSQEGRSLVVRLLSLPKQIVTATVTTIPHFFASNTLRDQVAAGLMTPNYVPGVDMVRGMKSELSQDEMSQLYAAMAGEVAGMTVAGERKARAERDIRALNPSFKRVKHFASLSAIARAVSVSETGTRQGIFRRHYEEYLKQGFTPKEAAIEARHVAHDYMPFSRRGAWPMARFLASVIPFENVALQSVDKGTRVLGVGPTNAMDWITQRKIPQTRQEIEAAKLSWKLWIGASVFGIVGMGLEALNSDEPWIEELGEYYKNSHWVVQLPGTDEVGLIPKEQYVGAFSNAFEALFNGIKKQDPKAGERFVSSMLQVWAPPTDSPVWNLPLELAAGKDSFGTPIVPEGKKDGLKSEQKRDDTKGLAVEFTDFLREKTKRKDGTSLIDWSPAMVDHLGKGLGTSWWRELPNEKGQAPIEQVGSETTMARRFIKAPWRGAQSTKEFFDLAGDGGKWADLAATANTLVLAGRKDDVAKMLESASPERRAYALASVFQEGREKQIHPMIRAEESVRVYRDLAKDLREGTVLAELPDGKMVPVKMTPHQRRLAVDELSKLAVAEQRNALIMTGVKGWTGTKTAIPTEPIRRKIFNEIPEMRDVLKYRARNVMPEAEGFVKWLGSRGGLEGPLNRELFNVQADEKQFGGSGAKERFLNQSIPVPAAPASR